MTTANERQRMNSSSQEKRLQALGIQRPQALDIFSRGFPIRGFLSSARERRRMNSSSEDEKCPQALLRFGHLPSA
jgi:hypothetical protein